MHHDPAVNAAATMHVTWPGTAQNERLGQGPVSIPWPCKDPYLWLVDKVEDEGDCSEDEGDEEEHP